MASSEKAMKMYIDTCVWISYYNATIFDGAKYPQANNAISFFELLGEKDTNVLFSYFNLIELTEQLRDTIISFRLLSEGYSVFNLSKARKDNTMNNTLTGKEDEKLTKILSKLTSFHFLQIINEPEEINKHLAEALYKLTGSFAIEMPDALHVVYALKNECNMIITTDKKLITQFKEAKKTYRDFKNLSIRHPVEIVDSPNLI